MITALFPTSSSRNQPQAPSAQSFFSDRLIFEGVVFKAPELDKFACVKQGPEEQYAIFTVSPGDVIEESPRFRWSRNDVYQTRVKWNESTQSWSLIPGAKPSLAGIVSGSTIQVTSTGFPVGSTLPGTNDQSKYSMFRIGEIPDETSYPVGKGITYSGILVVEDPVAYEFPTTSPPSGVISPAGVLRLHPALVDQFSGQNVWYSPTILSGTGDIGNIVDFDDFPVFISPIPTPLEYPCFTLGSRLPVNVIRCETETDLFSTTLPEGVVAYAASTGRIRVSPADIAKSDPHSPEFDTAWFETRLYYRGLFVGTDAGIPAPVQLLDDAILPYAGDTDSLNSGYILEFDGTGAIPKPYPEPRLTPGISGVTKGIPHGILYNENHTVAEIVVSEESPPPRGIVYAYDTAGGSVGLMMNPVDRDLFGDDPIYFRTLVYLPSLDFGNGIVSRKRWEFEFQQGDVFTIIVNNTPYSWRPQGVFTAEEAANAMSSVFPVSVEAVQGHVVIRGQVRVAYGYYVGNVLVRDLSGCKALGILPGWSASVCEDHGYGIEFDVDGGSTVSVTSEVSGVLVNSIPDSIFTFLQYTPLRDQLGFSDGVYFRVESGDRSQDLREYENCVYLFAEDKLVFASQTQSETAVVNPTSDFILGQSLVVTSTVTPPIGFLEVSEGAAFEQAQSLYFPQNGNAGTVTLTEEIFTKTVRGQQGIVTASLPTMLVDVTENFDDVPMGSLLFIPSLESVQEITQSGGNVLHVQPQIPAATNLQGLAYDIAFATPKGLLADIQYQSFSQYTEEPFSVTIITPVTSVPPGVVPVLYGPDELDVRSLLFLEIGEVKTDMVLPVFDWVQTPFRIQIGNYYYIPEKVTEFTTRSASIQCRITDGAIKVGSEITTEFMGSIAYVKESFPSAIPDGAAVVDTASGEIRSLNPVTWYQRLRSGTEVRLNPANGSFLLGSPLRAGQQVQVSYFVDDNGNKGREVTELLPFFVTETASRKSPTVYEITNTGVSEFISVSVGGALQNYGGTTDYRVVNGDLIFSKPVDPTFDVVVTYSLFTARGGEQTGTVSSPPVWRPPFNIPAGSTSFTVEGEQEFEIGGLLRLGSVIRVVESVVVGGDTTVTFSPASTTEIGSRSPGADVLTFKTKKLPESFWRVVENRVRPVVNKSAEIVVDGNIEVIPGLLAEVDGNVYVVTATETDSDGYWTKITLGESLLSSSVSPILRLSVRPPYPENSTTFLCPEGLIPEKGINVVIIGDTGRVLSSGDYAISNGVITLKSPLPYGHKLYISAVASRTLRPRKEFGVSVVPRLRAKFTHYANPSALGFQGKKLTANFRTYQPDQFGYEFADTTTLTSELFSEIAAGENTGTSLQVVRRWGSQGEYSRLEVAYSRDAVAARALTEIQPLLLASDVFLGMSGTFVSPETGPFSFILPESDIPAMGHFHPMVPGSFKNLVESYDLAPNQVDDIIADNSAPAYRHPRGHLFPSELTLRTTATGNTRNQETVADLSFPDERFESPTLSTPISVRTSTEIYELDIYTRTSGELVVNIPISATGALWVFDVETQTFQPLRSRLRVVAYNANDVVLTYPSAIWRRGALYDGDTRLRLEDIVGPIPSKYGFISNSVDAFDLSTTSGIESALASSGSYRIGVDVGVSTEKVVSLRPPETIFSILPFSVFPQIPTVQPRSGENIDVVGVFSYTNASPIADNVTGTSKDNTGYTAPLVSYFRQAPPSLGGGVDFDRGNPLIPVNLTVYGDDVGHIPGVLYFDPPISNDVLWLLIGVDQPGPLGMKGMFSVSQTVGDYFVIPRFPVTVENARMRYLWDNAAVFSDYSDGISIGVTTPGNVITQVSFPLDFDSAEFDDLFTNAEDGFLWTLEILKRDTDPGVDPVGTPVETLVFEKSGGFTVTSSLGTIPVISVSFTSGMTLETASPVVDLALFASTPTGITGTRAAAISVDSTVGSVVTGGIEMDGVTIYPGFDCTRSRPRGYTLPINTGITRETSFDIREIEISGGYVTSCSAAEINGGVPFTIPRRGSDDAGTTTSIEVASIEGFGNTVITGTFKAVAVPAESSDDFSGKMGGVGYDPMIIRTSEDLNAFQGSCIQVADGSKSGNYLVRSLVSSPYTAYSSIVSDPRSEFYFDFPVADSAEGSGVTVRGSLREFPDTGTFYVVMRESNMTSADVSVYANSVISASYTSKSETQFLGVSSPALADGTSITMSDFRDRVAESQYITAAVKVRIQTSFSGDTSIGPCGYRSIRIQNPITSVDEFVAVSDPDTVLENTESPYRFTPGKLDLSKDGIDGVLAIVHNPESHPGPGIPCLLKSDVFSAEESGGVGFVPVLGLYLEPTPLPCQNLNGSIPRIKSPRYPLAPVGIWNPDIEENVIGSLFDTSLFEISQEDEPTENTLSLYLPEEIPVVFYDPSENRLLVSATTTSHNIRPFDGIVINEEFRFVRTFTDGILYFFGDPVQTGTSLSWFPRKNPKYRDVLWRAITSRVDVVFESQADLETQDGAWVPSVNVLADTTVSDFRTRVRAGDWILVDPAGKLRGPDGVAHPTQWGRPSTTEVFIGDDNRGYYFVSEVNENSITVSCEFLLLKGDINTGDREYQGVWYYPSIVGEGQGDLRVTAYAPSRDFTTTASIAPFSYKVLRTRASSSREEVEFLLAAWDWLTTYQGEIEVGDRVFNDFNRFLENDGIADPVNTTLTEEINGRLYPEDVFFGVNTYAGYAEEVIPRLISKAVSDGGYYERRYALLDYRVNRETGTKIIAQALSARRRASKKKRKARGVFRRK